MINYCFRLLHRPVSLLCMCLLVALPAADGIAGPWVTTGDSALRSDIQILADAGHIMSPTMSWPLAWGDIKAALDDRSGDSPAFSGACNRKRKRVPCG